MNLNAIKTQKPTDEGGAKVYIRKGKQSSYFVALKATNIRLDSSGWRGNILI